MKERAVKKNKNDLNTLNVIEACKIFEVSRWTLRRMVKDSYIKGEKKGRQTIYSKTELKKLFKPIQYNKSIAIKAKVRESKIRLSVWCTGFKNGKGFKESKLFKLCDIEKQEKWLITYRKRFERNQKKFYKKIKGYADWGKLKYNSEGN